VFKEGTCLAKAHANFYRLSEDLDFTIPVDLDSTRGGRHKAIEPVKETCKGLPDQLPEFKFGKPLKGANGSTQYIATLEYKSLIASNSETIKLEISLREPLLQEAVLLDTQTILLNPTDNRRYFPPFRFPHITKKEAYSEKFRAAITRRDPAIRDYFDIDYAISHLDLDPTGTDLIQLVRRKIAVPGNKMPDDFANHKEILEKQLETELKPVLRSDDYEKFDLDRAFDFVSKMHERILKAPS